MDGVRIDLLFDADVEAFRIFTENDDIHIFERCFYGIVGSYRADVCVKIIFSAECYIQGAESFPTGVVIGILTALCPLKDA